MNIDTKKRAVPVFFRVVTLFTLFTTLITSMIAFPISRTYAVDLTPQYQTDNSGVYPTYSWSVNGQENVINSQGGDSVNGWDKVTNWDGDMNNTTNSYLKFGSDANNPDYQIRKFAKETATRGLFDLYLNAKGNDLQNIKPIDIVLVVDMSGSMNPQSNGGTDRVTAARNGVSNFLSKINSAGVGQYVNVGLVGFSSPGYIGGSNGYVSENIAPVSDTSHVTRINSILSQTFTGGTFTQQGIKQAQNMLASDTSGHKKLMIVLTDGVPTFSNQVLTAQSINGIVYGQTFNYTHYNAPGNTAQFKDSRSMSDNYSQTYTRNATGGYFYTASNLNISDTWSGTLGEALIAKNAGTEIHALGIQLSADGTYMTQSQVRSRMQLLTTTSSLYQDASSAADVEQYLSDQAKDVLSSFKTVNNGTIVDPLGSQYTYAAAAPEVKSVGSVPVTDLPKISQSTNSISLSGINLGKNQEIQIHYQIHLNTEDDSFKPNYWYQMNGTTTFQANNDASVVNFGIPSGKAPGTSISVSKQWQELDSSTRPSNIQFTVARTSSGNSTTWQASATLGAADQWSKSYTQLTRNGNSVWLPLYDNNGNTFKYSVISESNNDYIASITNNDVGSKIINTQYGIIIKKYINGTQSPLDGAQFSIKSTTSSFFKTINSNQLQILSPDTYSVQEIKSPIGYQLDSTVYSVRLTNTGQWISNSQVISQNSPTINGEGYADGFSISDKSNNDQKNNVLQFTKNNAVKNFDIVLQKIDKVTKLSLQGAIFELRDTNNKTYSFNETSPTSVFSFHDIQPGKYTLTETHAPDGYTIAAPVYITIANDGSVKVDGDAQWSSSLSSTTSNNQINLTISDTNKTVFPMTGGSGIRKYEIIATILFVISAMIGIFYCIRRMRIES